MQTPRPNHTRQTAALKGNSGRRSSPIPDQKTRIHVFNSHARIGAFQ